MCHAMTGLLTATLAVWIMMMGTQARAEETPTVNHRVHCRLLDPREHPDYDRRFVKPPSWETFGNRTQFTSLRGFGVENDLIVKYVEEIEKHTKTFDLGNVLWPAYPIVFAKNLGDLVDEIKRRGLYLFDIWGYVPGSGPGGYWQQYRPAPAVFELFESKLGDHWLGMDVGEQDGRYIGGYAGQMYPISNDRAQQYLNFQRHFEHMGDELGNRLSTLVSLNYGHYFLKEGTYTTIGAETAQGLPNGQVYYAFIRGAGKQYGVPWFGNASIWNRWGYKTYGSEGPDHGPTKGTSLNLLKRLLYSHILYNCVFVGFEAGHFESEQLSPVGRIHQAAHKWVQDHGQPGVMMTPVALMLDFFSGWTFPRHLYTGDVYRVWGNLPYEAGDYLTDGVLDLLYPGYQDSSYYHNESGFVAPTPYGDIADCLLTDAPGWLLARYPVIVLAGEVRRTAELKDKLSAYVEQGGCLVVTAGNLGPLGNLARTGKSTRFGPGQAVQVDGATVTEESAFELCALNPPDADAVVIANIGDQPAAVDVPFGKGRVIALASPFGVASEQTVKAASAGVDTPLPKPYPLLRHVQAILDRVLKEQMLFEVGEGLSLITCRKGPGEYTIGIANNALEPRPLKIVSHCGPIETAVELPLDQSEKDAVGYLPQGSEAAPIGKSERGEGKGLQPLVIAGGDVRVFAVKVREENVEEIAHTAPPKRPNGRVLPLRGERMIKEEVLLRPTFFEHFDGVLIDARYLSVREKAALQQEAGWIRRQGLRVYVDLTPEINLYPDLRLVNNDPEPYAASMAAIQDVIAKMDVLGARDLILSLHRAPENNFTAEQTQASFESSIKDICAQAANHEITVHLRTSPKGGASLSEVLKLQNAVGAANLRLAPSTALLLHQKIEPQTVAEQLKDNVGLWLVSAPAYDAVGALWTAQAPIADCADSGRLGELLRIAPSAPVALDAVYSDANAEYGDIRSLEGFFRK